MDTTIATTPTPNDMNLAILVCFSIDISFVITLCISSVQLVATEFNPVDKVDCAAAYMAASTSPDTPTGN